MDSCASCSLACFCIVSIVQYIKTGEVVKTIKHAVAFYELKFKRSRDSTTGCMQICVSRQTSWHLLCWCWEMVFMVRDLPHIIFIRPFSCGNMFALVENLTWSVGRCTSKTRVQQKLNALFFRREASTECYLWTRKSIASLPNWTRRTTWANITLEHMLAPISSILTQPNNTILQRFLS